MVYANNNKIFKYKDVINYLKEKNIIIKINFLNL